MELPKGLSQEKALEAIEEVVVRLVKRFRIPGYDSDDLAQEARIWGLECLSRYDGVRPLGGLLHSHIRNRLLNFRRDHFQRTDAPCPACYNSAPGHTQHQGGQYCEAYTRWLERNTAKQSINNPLPLDGVDGDLERGAQVESDVVVQAETDELLAVIERELPLDLRPSWLALREGTRVPANKRRDVEQAIRDILERAGVKLPMGSGLEAA